MQVVFCFVLLTTLTIPVRVVRCQFVPHRELLQFACTNVPLFDVELHVEGRQARRTQLSLNYEGFYVLLRKCDVIEGPVGVTKLCFAALMLEASKLVNLLVLLRARSKVPCQKCTHRQTYSKLLEGQQRCVKG